MCQKAHGGNNDSCIPDVYSKQRSFGPVTVAFDHTEIQKFVDDF